MNIEQIKKILKILARESCDLYSFNNKGLTLKYFIEVQK